MLKVVGGFTIERLRTLLGSAHPDRSLDLSGCTFIDPVGLVALGVLAESWGERQTGAWRTPTSDDTYRYMTRMHLPAVLSKVARVEPDRYLPVREKPQGDYLYELHATQSVEAARRIADLVLNRLADDAGDDLRDAIWCCVIEAWQNVTDHSQANLGFAAAQVLQRNTRDQRVVIGIADSGVGIAATLRKRLGDVADQVAIEQAAGGMSSIEVDPGRGMGLKAMRSVSGDLGGKLLIHSGSGGLIINRTGVRRSVTPMRIPGTIIGVELPCGVGR
jgi:hypothetical protein